VRDHKVTFVVPVGAKEAVPQAVAYPKQPADLLGEARDAPQHLNLPGGRFITTPPPITTAVEEAQRAQDFARVSVRADSWPPLAPYWWPALAFGHAILLAFLLWMFGLGRLFGLLPRR